MTIVYILLALNCLISAYVILVLNEVDRTNFKLANLITTNQVKTDEKLIELRVRLEELIEEGKL